jgi:transcriptional regulatory protein LevR
MRQALTFLATIGTDPFGMKTLAVISILALLTISGAAYTDQLLTSDQRAAQRADWTRFLCRCLGLWLANLGGTTTMLSVDQFLRLISVPAVIVAFLIASQVSGGVSYRPAQLQVASE